MPLTILHAACAWPHGRNMSALYVGSRSLSSWGFEFTCPAAHIQCCLHAPRPCTSHDICLSGEGAYIDIYMATDRRSGTTEERRTGSVTRWAHEGVPARIRPGSGDFAFLDGVRLQGDGRVTQTRTTQCCFCLPEPFSNYLTKFPVLLSHGLAGGVSSLRVPIVGGQRLQPNPPRT